MKLNICTYLEHECVSITTLKTDFDYKRAFIHNALQARFIVEYRSFNEASLNPYGFFLIVGLARS